MLQQIKEATEYLKTFNLQNAEIGIILGSGLGNFASALEESISVSYSNIPHFPQSTVIGHAGKLTFGTLQGKKTLVMQGRFHYYEGYSMQQIVFPIRVMKQLGIKYLIVTNAAGCLNLNWNLGDLMLVEDHINLMGGNPLIGKNEDELGPRFPEMGIPYDTVLQELMITVAKEKEIEIRKGVYAAVTGPSYETRAEYRYLKTIGADVVGMSTVPEIIAARHMNIQCLAISVLTDMCDPDTYRKVTHEKVIEIANQAENKLSSLLVTFIQQLP